MIGFLMAFMLFFSALSCAWQDRKAEGWAWYENKPEKEVAQKQQSAEKSPQEIISEAKELLEIKLQNALLDPSDENLHAYLTEQKKWIDQSALFSKNWARFLLKQPQFDETLNFSTSQYVKALEKRKNAMERERFIQEAAKKFGLFFFYQGRCPYSKAFAEVLQSFVARYSWNLIAISLDGEPCHEAFSLREDRGISQQFAVDRVPALFLVDTNSQSFMPLSVGAVSLEQLETNLVLSLNRE